MNKGLIYTIEEEKIRKFMKLSAEDKLKWLAEIIQFSKKALTEKEKRIWELFRSEKI